MEVHACPKCGATAGFERRVRIAGYVTEWTSADGTATERLSGEDGARYTEPKTVRCYMCDARVPNPYGPDWRRQ